jgi:fructokinase
VVDVRNQRRRIGIDLGGTKIEGVVLGDDNEPLCRRRIATQAEQGYAHIIERIAQLTEELTAAAGIECRVIGVGTPGAVRADGTLKNSNTTCLNGTPLPHDLQQRLGRSVLVENDANCFALAEATCGAARDAGVVFGVILGTGVGGGIVCRGELLRGPQHIGGEWGHHSIDANGPSCYCGQRGCVERFISGPAVAERYRQLAGATVTMEDLVDRYRAGDETAGVVFGSFLDRFGRAVANLVDILDPDVIVLGGGLSNVAELYSEGRAAVAGYVFNDELLTPIRRNQLGDSAGVIGAALLT